MPTSPGRGNGLPATSWAALADLDPRLADAMLDALREAGVAAYAAPSTGTRGAYLEVRLPDRPTDRLYVDTASAARAREVLTAELPRLRAALDEPGEPEPNGVDEDVWAALVASYESTDADPVPRWPVSEDVDDDSTDTNDSGTTDTGTGGDRSGSRADTPGRRTGRLLRPALRQPPSYDSLDLPAGDFPAEPLSRGPAEDPTDHYVPPDPPPLPEGDIVSRLAWIGVVGGPVMLLVAALLRWELSGWLALLPLVAFVAGFVTLVARMRDRPNDEDDPDDGAVV